MEKMTNISPVWQKWLVENLERGCTPQSLIDVMVERDFDPMYAGAIVLHFSSGGRDDASFEPTPQPVRTAPRTVAERIAHNPYVYETSKLKPGHLIQTNDRVVQVVSRLEKPRIAVLDNVFSAEECDELVRLSQVRLKRSAIVDPQTGQGVVVEDRNSFGTAFQVNETEFIAQLDQRIAQIMSWPVGNGEGLQVLNYRVGGEYKPHYDYFPEDDPGSRVHLYNGGQRVSTLVIYLNEVEEGGNTIFPELGLSISPRKGSAVYFEYANSAGQVDTLTLHGGNPVLKGEKWIATKWMRQRHFT